MGSIRSPLLHRVRALLPHGRSLPLESWRARHRAILVLAALHAVGVPIYGISQGQPALHCIVEAGAIASLAAIAWVAGHQNRQRVASSAASLALLTGSAEIVHFSAGLTEAHFHFFVVIVVLTLYEDWAPFLVALGFVAVHHVVGGLVDPTAIYSHGGGDQQPWRWAGIHAGFVAAAGVAGVSTWKHNEQERERALGVERDADKLYHSVVETLTEGVLLHGPDGALRAANPSAARILGLPEDVLVGSGSTGHDAETIREDGTAWVQADYPVMRTARTGEAMRDVVVGLRQKDAAAVTWLSISTRPLQREGDGWSVVASLTDVTERKRALADLERLADHDGLTGLLNRRSLETALERDLAVITRHGNEGAVLVIDLDNFKYVNDSLGHAVGDEMICRAAEAITGRVRKSDTVARLGGDEFALVLPHTGTATAGDVAQGVLDAIRRQVVVDTVDGPRRTTASIGVALMAAGDTPQQVMAHADMAMYQAKERGKDRTVLFDPGDDRQGQAKLGLAWAERIRTAVQDDRLLLHAQPIQALSPEGPARRFELLVRMRSENGELVSPGVFLPVAERFDLIGDIDRWVLRRAARLLGELREAGEHDIHLSVNLSARSIDIDMLDVLRGALDRSNGDPRNLTVEITETAAIADLERAKAFATGLAAMGCRLALDDFGAGFASFHYLKHLNFDEIKIDGEYVRDMAESETHRLVVRSLVDIAVGLGKDVTAEFVADPPTVELLRAYGVRWGQGFYLGKPKDLVDYGIETGLVAGGAGAVPRQVLVAGRLPAVPEPVVEHVGRDL